LSVWPGDGFNAVSWSCAESEVRFGWDVTERTSFETALRALEDLLTDINNLSYRPRPVAQFSEFAKRWQEIVLSQHKPSTQPPIRSQLRKHLIPQLDDVAMKDITGELSQSFISDCDLSAKTVKNLVGTLRIMWNSAKAWGYVRARSIWRPSVA